MATGILLGENRDNGQHIVYDVEISEMVRARTIMRMPNARTWSKDDIAAVRVTSYQLHVPKELELLSMRRRIKSTKTTSVRSSTGCHRQVVWGWGWTDS